MFNQSSNYVSEFSRNRKTQEEDTRQSVSREEGRALNTEAKERAIPFVRTKRLRRQARSAECSVCFGISVSPSRVCRKLCAGQADCDVSPPSLTRRNTPVRWRKVSFSPLPFPLLTRKNSFFVQSRCLLLVLFLRMRGEKQSRKGILGGSRIGLLLSRTC